MIWNCCWENLSIKQDLKQLCHGFATDGRGTVRYLSIGAENCKSEQKMGQTLSMVLMHWYVQN